MDRISIGKRIKYERERHGLSQDDIGSALAVSKQCISGWENGRNMPDVISMYKLSKIFGILIEDMLGDNLSKKGITENQSQSRKADFILSDKEFKIINKLRTMPPEKKHAVETLFGVKK